MNQTTNNKGFFSFGMDQRLVRVLSQSGFNVPTQIQEKVIPLAIAGKDVVGIAQTGTGKTLAFIVPMLQKLGSVSGIGLIMVPTRELALQIEEMAQEVGGPFGLRTAVLIGGTSLSRQKEMIRRQPHIIIGTPGRVNDHLNQKSLSLRNIKVLVLDEADRMLDIGFLPQIKRILQALPRERQTMLFSATMSNEIFSLASAYMIAPVRVEVAPAGTVAERVNQELFVISNMNKSRLLGKILNQYHGSVLVFCRTKFGAKKISSIIRKINHTSAEIHSNRSLNQRREALEGFKSGKYRVLVGTDIAARGIDVSGIELVINYDLPEQAEDYVHRIGRTGRAGQPGLAISFATPDQRQKVRNIERLIRKPIAISKYE